jgi:threonine dehydrogenase-like Zn-dependent dehydrogenase
MNVYRGTSPQFRRAVRDGLFVEGEPAYKYPMTYGYEEVAEVVEVGGEVADLKVGDVVATAYGHRETKVLDPAQSRRFHVVPEGFPPERAVFHSLAGVALNDYLSSEIRLGESAVVIGLGVIGLFVLQLCRLGGVSPLVAVDLLPARLARASQLGADHTLNPREVGDVAVAVREALGTLGADVVFEHSGTYRGLHQAIRCCAPIYGKVMAVSWYQGGGSDLALGEEWHHSFTGRAGASRMAHQHLGVPPAPGRQWDIIRIGKTAFGLLTSGKLATDGLITQRIPFSRAAEAYQLIDQHPDQTVKVILDFTADG